MWKILSSGAELPTLCLKGILLSFCAFPKKGTASQKKQAHQNKGDEFPSKNLIESVHSIKSAKKLKMIQKFKKNKSFKL